MWIAQIAGLDGVEEDRETGEVLAVTIAGRFKSVSYL
jgi:hypothetical protein